MQYVIAFFPICTVCFLVWLVIKDKLKQSYSSYLDGTSSKFVLALLLIFGLLLISYPWLITNKIAIPFKYESVGEIGDLIGGSTAPLIGFVGIIVTFYAFWVQFQSNINQRKDIQLERFENQYYEMLRLHKENVQEMEIGSTITGRKCFVRMFYEFKYIYLAVYHASKSGNEDITKIYTKEEISALAYKVFFNGSDSILTFRSNIYDSTDIPLLINAHKDLDMLQKGWRPPESISKPTQDMIQNEDGGSWYTFEQFYYPFDGHSSRLSHYYRHLFQTVSFVVESSIVPNRLHKYRYLKLLRAQLSNHEQALLFYNGITSFGNEWISLGYFSDYRIIKNVPFNVTDFGIRPYEKISSPNRYDEIVFEWLE